MTTHVVGDTTVLTGRTLRHVTRSPDTIITTVLMPVAIMLMFVYVLGGAVDTGHGPDRASYVNYLLPGILLITVASGIAYTAVRLFQDMSGGIVERLRAMPIAHSAILWSHVITSLVANLTSLTIVIAIAASMGFRPRAGMTDWLAIGGILVLFTLTLTWVAVVPGLTASTVDGASAFSFPLIFLPFLSSAFVPTETMPGPLRWFAEHQPVTPIVNSLRSLFSGEAPGLEIWVALAWCVGVLLAAYAIATWIVRRRLAS